MAWSEERCSFCSKHVPQLVAGNGVFICDACLRRCNDAELPVSVAPAATCSFCGKRRDAVKRMIAGPASHICDECVSFGTNVIEEWPLHPRPT